MTSAKPRVGYIGTGWTERVQIPAFLHGGLQPQAICANNIENAQRVAAKFQIPEVHQDWQALIASPQVEIVSIVTPPHLHEEIAIAALQAGKHVICEKPTALNTAQAERMFAAAQAAPNQIAIFDHELRFHPHRQALHGLVREHALGALLHVEMRWRSPHRLNAGTPWNWHSDVNLGGGMLGAIGSHLLDLSRWIFGRIDGLSATLTTGHLIRNDPQNGAKRRVTSDDQAILQVRFASGLRGLISATALDPGKPGMSMMVVGTEGAAWIDDGDYLWIKAGEGYPNVEWAAHDNEIDLPKIPEVPNPTAFARGSVYLAQALAKALQAGETQLADAATFYDGLVVQRMLDAARKSNQNHEWVRL